MPEVEERTKNFINTVIFVSRIFSGLKDKFNEMINFSSKTGFDTFYLWGAEWWYWLDKQGHPEHWQRAKELFTPPELL